MIVFGPSGGGWGETVHSLALAATVVGKIHSRALAATVVGKIHSRALAATG